MWGVELLGDSSVTIRIAVKCVPDDQWAVARDLRSRIKDQLDEAGIEIPFPQQSVWVRSEGERQPV
jgi:small conductance mechanosensitive channel